ncbi:MAG: DUF6702 family protein [Chitinophagaceae bacterium]
MQLLLSPRLYVIFLFLAAVCVLSSYQPAGHHPFYVTVTEFSYNAKDKQLAISCKLFADDFETALKKQFKTTIDFTNPRHSTAFDKMVLGYCSEHLKIRINGNAVQLKYVGFEKESDAAWCYFHVADVGSIKKLEITNNLLYELYDREINIMRASVGGIVKSTRLEHPATQAVFEW